MKRQPALREACKVFQSVMVYLPECTRIINPKPYQTSFTTFREELYWMLKKH